MKPNGSADSYNLYVPPLRVIIPVAIFCWVAISLFNTGIFIFSAEEGIRQYGFLGALRWTLFYHSPWLLMLPLILAIARKFPVNENISLRNLMVHIAAAVGIAFLTSALHTIFIYIRLGEAFELNSMGANFLYYFDDRFLLYVVVLVGYYAVDYYQKQSREYMKELQLEETLNRERLSNFKTNIQPAFLLNTLEDIEILITENPSLAEQLIADLAQMIRRLLISSQKKNISREDDLHFLKTYIHILGIRLRRDIQFDMPPPADDKTKKTVISLYVIPVVEQLLEKDKNCFSSLVSISLMDYETRGQNIVQLQMDRFLPVRSDLLNGRTNMTEFKNMFNKNGEVDLHDGENGTLTISIKTPRKVS